MHWTLKEALSKILRTGMTTPFDIFSIKELKQEKLGWISSFQNFAQYQGLSFLDVIEAQNLRKNTAYCKDVSS